MGLFRPVAGELYLYLPYNRSISQLFLITCVVQFTCRSLYLSRNKTELELQSNVVNFATQQEASDMTASNVTVCVIMTL